MNIFHFFSALLTPSIRGVLSICEGGFQDGAIISLRS